MITIEQFTELAHRTASRYSHRSEPARAFYTFSPESLADFHRQVCAAVEADRAQRVPDGWKLVPVDPTEEMLCAGDDVLREAFRDRCIATRTIYDAMLASTPAPAQQEPDCPRCKGSGEDPEGYFDQSRGPDGDTYDGPCRDCAGTGAAKHQEPPQQEPAPIDMVLHCPACGMQHIDDIESTLEWTGGSAPEPSHEVITWDNPPHRSHLCHCCGHIWRPADVPTNGVQAVKTKGKADSPAPPQQERQIAEALRRRGLTLVKTANGYDVLELGEITAQASGPQQERKPMTDELLAREASAAEVSAVGLEDSHFADGFVSGFRRAERHHGIKE